MRFGWRPIPSLAKSSGGNATMVNLSPSRPSRPVYLGGNRAGEGGSLVEVDKSKFYDSQHRTHEAARLRFFSGDWKSVHDSEPSLSRN